MAPREYKAHEMFSMNTIELKKNILKPTKKEEEEKKEPKKKTFSNKTKKPFPLIFDKLPKKVYFSHLNVFLHFFWI